MRRRSLQPLSDHHATSKTGCISSNRYAKLTTPNSQSMVFEKTDICFNDESRRLHIQNIIDSYFDSSPGELLTVKPAEYLPNSLSTMRRRASLVARTSQEDSLTKTSPHPFNLLNKSEVIELNKTFLSDQSLPPIFEAGEDPEAIHSSLYDITMSSLIWQQKTEDKSHASIVNTKLIKRRPKIVAENQLYTLIQTFLTQSKHPTFIVKEYKPACHQIFLREQKAWQILATVDIKRLWTQNGLQSCQARPFRPLKLQLFEISRESIKSQTVYKINTRHHYDELFTNGNQKLKKILNDLLKQLSLINGRIINNKISLSNICVVGDDVIVIEWGHSAIMQSIRVGNETMTNQITPIIKGQTEWFVTPEYLPPELLEYVAGISQYDMWSRPSAVDMWSVGCMMLQLFMLVPLWSPFRCQITGKPTLSHKGLFCSKTRQLLEISTKQRKFCSNIKLHLDRLGQIDKRANPKLIELMIRMLSIDPERRPTAQQAMSLLN